jgi:hypothetical protein
MQKNGRIILVGILVLLALVGIANATLSNGTISGHAIPAILGNGNVVTCPAAGCSGDTLFIQKNEGESYDGRYYIDATHYIDIDANSVMGSKGENSINWRSNFDVICVVLKGANGYDTYYCTNDYKRDDSTMSPPINPSKAPADISHILICYYPPESVPVPEFPAWFITLMGIAGLVGMLVAFQRK